MKLIKFIIAFSITLALFAGCKKSFDNTNTSKKNEQEIQIPENFFAHSKVPGVVENSNAENSNVINSAPAPGGFDLNNGEDQVILGNQLTNPYTVSNMQNAATIIYGGTAPTLVANHKYVRFKPADADQFDELEENQDLELQDYPMDYDVIQDGDYYQDPTLGTEDIGWLYTVVPINYVPPAGIQYEVISTLYLTDNALLEDMAESLASGLIYSYQKNSNGTVTITRNDNGSFITMRPPNPCDILPIDHVDYCGGSGSTGTGGNGGTTTVDGGIFVQEQTICGQPITEVPLRKARIVAKRWFKVWRGYTDDNGDFTVTKRFKNKVKVIVKTKNNEAKVCKVRGIRLWQMLFPAKRRIGVFNSNELSNIRYVFNKPTDGNAHNKELTYWAAASTHNSIVEFRQYTAEFGLTQPPGSLKVMVTNWGFMRNAGAAPMWNKCHNSVIPTIWAATFIAGGSIGGLITGGVIALVNTLKNRMDLIIGYTSDDYNCLLTSPQLKALVYHELGHAQHYAQVGCSFWENYRNAVTVELSKTNQAAVHPYGTGNDGSTAPILATGEMWGNHIEKWYSERHYTGGATPQNVLAITQGRLYVNDVSPTTIYNGFFTNSITGLNANYAAIESYNPTTGGVWPWIPEGLCYDLWDNRNEGGFPIIDEANGFTINQCFNALQTDVQSIPAFRNRLLQQNGNLQLTQVTQLFQRYGY